MSLVDAGWSTPPAAPSPAPSGPPPLRPAATGGPVAPLVPPTLDPPEVAAAPDAAPPGADLANGSFPPPLAATPGSSSLFASPEPVGSSGPAGATTPVALLGQKLRLGSVVIPLPLALAALVLSVATLSVLLGVGTGFVIGSARTDAAPPPESPAAREAAPEAKSADRLQRARAGEAAALKMLEQVPADRRSADELLALAEGNAAAAVAAMHELERALARDAAQLGRHRAKLLDFAASPITAVAAVRTMAALPGPEAADLLYEVWTGTAERTPTTELAEMLVYSAEVRPRASPALGVALDLRRARTCDEFAAVLPQAIEHADRRSHHLLGRLTRRYGCGKKKSGDCYPCLRQDDRLDQAMRAAKTRPAPSLR